MTELPPSAEELLLAAQALQACAMRFDGYRYVEVILQCGLQMIEWLTLAVQDCTSGRRQPSTEEAFAILFALHMERRDSGWFTHGDVRDLLGCRLYLQLLDEPTPRRWWWEPFSRRWEELSHARKRAAAAIVRRWLHHHESLILRASPAA